MPDAGTETPLIDDGVEPAVTDIGNVAPAEPVAVPAPEPEPEPEADAADLGSIRDELRRRSEEGG